MDSNVPTPSNIPKSNFPKLVLKKSVSFGSNASTKPHVEVSSAGQQDEVEENQNKNDVTDPGMLAGSVKAASGTTQAAVGASTQVSIVSQVSNATQQSSTIAPNQPEQAAGVNDIKNDDGWDWTSNGSFCSSGSRIILGWNVDAVDLNVVAMTDQVVHTFIRYTHRRPLWDNLGLHNQLVHNRPWCILGDFNSALNLEDKVEGSSVIDIAMREFKECVDANELVDINRSGLQFTWSQKPRGLDGTLRKIDRIMANIGFLDSFAGAHDIFQSYHVSDHYPTILHIPMMCKFEPRPFKFSNILVQNSRFKQQVQESWCNSVSGFHMFKVVSKLKALKKPFRSMLFREGNIHEKVTKLRHKLDVVQRALDLDPFNVDLPWFDKWCSVGPLSLIVSSRDIHRAGFSSNSLVRDIISEDAWAWPNMWRFKPFKNNSPDLT
ncbi:RNA-directed DNA polymerase, eukaryota, Reverse transcriptase zinc-binding domain protein [Artemisia annua]|uniref:RNA-directed DNA polymerase, eukaryota, Reverse transcriptase zinc-binding domain protein n=1 Tax=Artemisia annua TaxID=35608 RepID=A0A2U1M3K6_ARTAN|nr:RNA-directed DNA polymerase, eukaryota, Reverse transcriptase zinc-binding domain protein [Artemisia annua]